MPAWTWALATFVGYVPCWSNMNVHTSARSAASWEGRSLELNKGWITNYVTSSNP